MASAMTEFVKVSSLSAGQPFSLIEHKGLLARLGEELARATNELIHDPRGFIDGLFSPADSRDQKRRRLIYIGLGGALVAHAALLIVMVIAGWHRILEAPKEAGSRPEYQVDWLEKPTQPKPQSGKTTGPKGEAEHVLGGGGQRDNTPSSVGVPPRALPQLPPIIRANPSLLHNEPTLAVTPNIQGIDDKAPPPPGSVLGDPNGKPGPFSAGPGTGDGLGGERGSGVGPNRGSGGPKGGAGNVGSAEGGKIDRSGTTISAISYSDPRRPEGFLPTRWIHRPTPVVTPEAQAHKVSGTVLLVATFRADGTITDIEIKNPVPFMTESAIDALKRSRFRPATINGIPITMFRVPVRIDVELTGHP
jgi:TonB family protein